MRSWALVVCACIAGGCRSGAGVEIDVISSIPFDRAELFVSQEPLTSCSAAGTTIPCPQALHWATDQQHPPYNDQTQIFTLADDAGWFASVDKDGHAKLRVEISDATQTIARLAVVSYRCADPDCVMRTPVATASLDNPVIPQDHVEIWKVTLDPADVDTDDSLIEAAPLQGQPDRRVYVWNKPPPAPATSASCAMLQHWDGAAWQTEYFAPPTDPDCDGYVPLTNECNPYWFDFGAGQTRSDCTTMATSTICKLGRTACVDGTSSSMACTARAPEFCVPEPLCNCPNPLADDCLQTTAAAGMAVPDGAFTWAQCQFSIDSSGSGCNGGTNTLAFPMGSVACVSAGFRDIVIPLATPTSAFSIGGGSVIIHLATGATPCTLSLQIVGPVASPASQPTFLDVLFPPAATSTVERNVLLPIQVDLVSDPGCTGSIGSECMLHGPQTVGLGFDTMFKCTQ